jgi:hypothetical protein
MGHAPQNRAICDDWEQIEEQIGEQIEDRHSSVRLRLWMHDAKRRTLVTLLEFGGNDRARHR